jgi:hypothetical protein
VQVRYVHYKRVVPRDEAWEDQFRLLYVRGSHYFAIWDSGSLERFCGELRMQNGAIGTHISGGSTSTGYDCGGTSVGRCKILV